MTEAVLEEHHRKRILPFLGEFILHSSDSGLEEEGNQIFVRTFCPDLFQGRDILRTVLEFDNQQWMTSP